MSRDYLISMVENNFCPTYPKSLILLGHLDLEGEDPAPSGESRAHEQYSDKLKEMMEASRTCRCRQRIPVPVLVISNKIISRSAGLSEALELAYETGSMAPIKYAPFDAPIAAPIGEKQSIETVFLFTPWCGVCSSSFQASDPCFLLVTLLHTERR